ncbi:MAG: hypothetical protein GY822_21785 [Deltaproteobacteria bacterium]|nr:hypothetical protein [Deltaproteobacteria bacterium]
MKCFWNMRSLYLFFALPIYAGCPSHLMPDAGNSADAGNSVDAGTSADAGKDFNDAGKQIDAGQLDAGVDVDAGYEQDAGRVIRDAGVDAGEDAGELLFLSVLENEGDLRALANAEGEVKYLAPVALRADRVAPLVEDCYFQNTALTPWHIEFLQEFPELSETSYLDYIDWVLKADTRRYWGGSIRRRQMPHPLTQGPTLSFSVYAEDSPGNELTVAQLSAAFALLSTCIPYADGELAFQPQGSAQAVFSSSHQGELADLGIGVLP